MLYIHKQPMQTVSDLFSALNNAILLEHSTIPPYLTAYYSLIETSESVRYARCIIRDIIVEEMLHMTLAANVLNAIGGSPVVNSSKFIPKYPGPLPMGIGDDDGDAPGEPLVVGLKRYSKETVEDVFMAIEEPEKKFDIPVHEIPARAVAEEQKFETIGQFYRNVQERIKSGGESLFENADPGKQVSSWFQPDEIVSVTDVETAVRAIDIIVEQGEGTLERPVDFQGDIPHYYRFESLAMEKKAVQVPVTDENPLGVVYDSNQPIVIDPTTDVIQMADNPRLIDLSHPAHAHVSRLSDEFDTIYSKLLSALQIAFNGNPDKMGEAVGIMFELKNAAEELMRQELQVGPHAEMYAGPRFQFVGS